MTAHISRQTELKLRLDHECRSTFSSKFASLKLSESVLPYLDLEVDLFPGRPRKPAPGPSLIFAYSYFCRTSHWHSGMKPMCSRITTGRCPTTARRRACACSSSFSSGRRESWHSPRHCHWQSSGEDLTVLEQLPRIEIRGIARVFFLLSTFVNTRSTSRGNAPPAVQAGSPRRTPGTRAMFLNLKRDWGRCRSRTAQDANAPNMSEAHLDVHGPCEQAGPGRFSGGRVPVCQTMTLAKKLLE